MELQRNLSDFERSGVAVFTISYDPANVLAAFVARHGISYTMLSDEGSQVIRRFDLLNRHVVEQQAYYGRPVEPRHQGIAYPGSFMLDEQGLVVEKRFEQSYRVRPAAVFQLEGALTRESGPIGTSVESEGPGLQAAAWSIPASYYPYQKLLVRVALLIAPGLHVYGQPCPQGYAPLTVAVDPVDGLEVEAVALPDPRPLRVDLLDETLHIYEGPVEVGIPLLLAKDLGDVSLTIRVGYQACGETICYPPSEITLALPLKAKPLVQE